ncbi:MAG: efflux RND transporter periplasmic adaptor subunit [Planctomycetota bacterium]
MSPSPRTSFVVVLVVLAAFAVGVLAAPRMRATLGLDAPRDDGATAAAEQLWTCGMHPQVIQNTPGDCPICHMKLTPISAAPSTSENRLTIDPVVVQNMGVRIETVRTGALKRTLRLAGYLKEPEPTHLDINLRVSGWIEGLYANADGIEVMQGRPLFDLYSPDLTLAIQELIAARRARAQSGSSGSDATSPGDALYRASARKLVSLGLTDDQIEAFARAESAPRTVTFVSPMTGHVTEKNISIGSAVKAGDTLFRLASSATLWLEMQVFEQHVPFVKLGQTVRARIAAVPGRAFEGQVLFIHPHIDPMTRSAMARCVIANPDEVLRQGMYAEAEIDAMLSPKATIVSRSAVIDTGTRQIAFVALGQGEFEARELELGASSPDGDVEVLAGLAPGDSVVTSGQFLLDAESRIREAIDKHRRGSLAVQPAPAPAARATSREAPQEALDALFRAYLATETPLGVEQMSDAPLDVRPVSAAAATLAQSATSQTRVIAMRVQRAVDAIAAEPLDEQRARWREVADAIIALADRSPPSEAVAAKLYVLHCPMAPGSWLAADTHIANPFYATTMKECGEVVRAIEPAREP